VLVMKKSCPPFSFSAWKSNGVKLTCCHMERWRRLNSISYNRPQGNRYRNLDTHLPGRINPRGVW
uniref:Uncharacterized protein n=1 Tax=Parascaris univalens TaxID=6257 RepID=A0A915BLC7_PARUN